MIWKRIVVREMERALVFMNGQLQAVETPGVYRMFSLRRGLEVVVVSTLDAVLRPALADGLLRSASALVEQNFVRVVVGEGRAAMVFGDGVLIRVLNAGESALVWRGPRTVTVREFDIVAEPAVEASLIPALTRFGAAAARVQFVMVPEQSAGLIFVNGQLVRSVGPGMHAFWAALGNVRAELVELRRQVLEVNAQEILTKDKVTLRVNISAEFRVTVRCWPRVRCGTPARRCTGCCSWPCGGRWDGARWTSCCRKRWTSNPFRPKPFARKWRLLVWKWGRWR